MQRNTLYLVMLFAWMAGAMPAHAAPAIQSSYLANWSRVFATSQDVSTTQASADLLESYLARRERFGVAPSLTSREVVTFPAPAALQIYLARRESFGRRPALTSAEFNTMTIEEALSAYLEKRAKFGTAPIEAHLADYLARRDRVQVSHASDALTKYLARRTAWGTAPKSNVEPEIITAVDNDGFAAQRWTVASND